MRIIAGSATDTTLKVCNLEAKNVVIQNHAWGSGAFATASHDRSIDFMNWGQRSIHSDDPETEIIFASSKDGEETVVNIWNFEQSKCLLQLPYNHGRVRGINVLSQDIDRKKILLCSDRGQLDILDVNLSVLENNTNTVATQTISPQLNRMRLSPSSNVDSVQCAFGGKEVETTLWDVTQSKCVWKARNVKHDNVNLRVPVCVNDLQFANKEGTKIVIGSQYQQVRLYDTKAQRKPVLDTKLRDPIMCIDLAHDERTLVCGDAKGMLTQVDLRNGRVVGCMKGVAGSVRSVMHHPLGLPYVASCSLDRHVYVHDIKSRKLRYKMYLKQKLNCVLFCSEQVIVEKEEVSAEKEVDPKTNDSNWTADDDMWNSLPTVMEKSRKADKEEDEDDDDDEEEKGNSSDSSSDDSDDSEEEKPKPKKKNIKANNSSKKRPIERKPPKAPSKPAKEPSKPKVAKNTKISNKKVVKKVKIK